MCLSNIFVALFPFRIPMASATEYLGGIDIIRWIWSICTFPATISIPLHRQSSLMILRTEATSALCNIRNRYFGHHIAWYLYFHTACANLLKCLTVYLLLIVRVTPAILRRYFIIHKLLSLPNLHSIASTISITDGLKY